jgi:DNA-binding CsgD family transcriptional regulator
MKNAAHLLDCLATGYRMDLDDATYVREVARSAARAMNRGLGILAYTYDASDPGNPVIDHLAKEGGFDTAWLPRFYEGLAAIGANETIEQPLGFAAWGGMTCGQASKVAGMRAYLPAFAHIGGARDTFAVNALDASGRGLWIGAPMRSTRTVAKEDQVLYSRLAAHLTAAVRLRRNTRLASASPAAVLSPSGALLHAEGNQAVELRDQLRRAALAFDRARTREARKDVDLATRRWRPLVESSWSLLDECDSDGRRLILAVDNRPPTPAPRGQLSEREHQVLTQAHLGHSNKVIAYELGLSSATVRVLMHRASRKLGTSTRAETVTKFATLDRPAQL